MHHTVRCVSTHHEDLADGRQIEPLGRAENVDIADPHNARLINEGCLIVEGHSQPPTVDEILASVGDDATKAQAALDLEQAEARPRKTLIEPLEAIVAAAVPPPTTEEASA